ncbi:hypothetical protein DVK02_05905 [Halobellus sp. Atlit-31R]|nr:hypothetical protein DVK02_05905 [Halobellus sp. Atlit-31R]
MARQLSPLLTGFLLGLLVAGGVVYVTPSPQSSIAVPSMTTTTATGCADSDPPRAWVGQTPTSEHRSVVFQNYSFTHEARDIELRANLTETADGHWLLAYTTRPETSRGSDDSACVPRTTVSSSVALPSDFETLTVRLDGEPITTVRSTERPQFSYLDRAAA